MNMLSGLELYRLRKKPSKTGYGSKPALLVIDMQRDWLEEGRPFYLGPDGERTVQSIIELVTAARENGVPVIFTLHVFTGDERLDGLTMIKSTGASKSGAREGTEGFMFAKGLEPRPGDLVIKKRRYSAFYNTELDAVLRALGADTVVVSGATAMACVKQTSFDAFQRDYRVVVPKECVADRAKEVVDFSLFCIDMLCGDVVSLPEVLSYFSSLSKRIP